MPKDDLKLSFEQWADLIDEARTRNAIGDMSLIAYRMAKTILAIDENLNGCFTPGSPCGIRPINSQERIEILIKHLLIEIGENPNRTGLKDTPKRVAKMYSEMFKGYDSKQKPKLTVFPNDDDGLSFKGMIIDQGYFFSACEHHMVPFFGNYFFGYIADKHLIGASKIGRLVNFHSAKLQIAERLCREILDDIEKAVKPKGCILIMRARHLCKEMRGVKMFNSPFEADDARGLFLDNDGGCKTEFINRIGV